MPTYEYKCSDCNYTFDLFHSMKDSPKIKCPACGKNTLKKQLGTGSGIIFKGSGFYQTDYRSSSYQKAAKADSNTTSTTKETTKKDTKTETKKK